MERQEAKVTVIVVSYNTVDLVCQAVEALLDPSQKVHEVIVVDNASTDGTADTITSRFPSVKLVKNTRNMGFGAANNQGLDLMTGDIALLLNSDARPKSGAIPTLSAVFADPTVVAAGGRLQFPDGRLQESACKPLTLWAVFCEQSLLEKLLPNSPFFSPYWKSKRLLQQGTSPTQVSQVMGACLMLRPVEKFDERFFLYCEDTELCHRLNSHGKILYVPEAVFDHELGASSTKNRWMSVARNNRGKELYFQLHHGRFQAALCWVMNRKGALLRLLGWCLYALLTLGSQKGRSQTALFAKVLCAPLNGPPLPPDSR